MPVFDSLDALLAEAQQRQRVVEQAQAELQKAQTPLIAQSLALAAEHRCLFEPLYRQRNRLDRSQPSYDALFGDTPRCSLREPRWAIEGTDLCIRGSYPEGDWVEYVCVRLPLRYLGANGAALMATDARAMGKQLDQQAQVQQVDQQQALDAQERALLAQLQLKWGTAPP